MNENETPPCKTHPDAPHGFDRNASHSADRYVCECEGWEPDVDVVNMSQDRVDETAKGEHIKCIVKDCPNHIGQGRFVGNLCSPCHEFLKTGDGVYSQAYRNTKREWVGLTDEEAKYLISHFDWRAPAEQFVSVIEAKLKEKNT